MSLFANQREATVASTVALVEQALRDLGHPTEARRPADPGARPSWQIVTGAATAQVAVVDRDAFPHLRVSAVVMTLDAAVDRAALFAHLLALNAELCGAAFATEGDRVMVVSERSTLDLDHSEVVDAISRVTTCADEHDQALVARFGGQAGGAAT